MCFCSRGTLTEVRKEMSRHLYWDTQQKFLHDSFTHSDSFFQELKAKERGFHSTLSYVQLKQQPNCVLTGAALKSSPVMPAGVHPRRVTLQGKHGSEPPTATWCQRLEAAADGQGCSRHARRSLRVAGMWRQDCL